MFDLLKSKFKWKHLLGALALLASLTWLVAFSFPGDKLQIVFCDVGQGDAILIQKGENQILIDGGPNKKVLDCLSNTMPFYDRTIEIIVLTHPQADHLAGISFVMERYDVGYFLIGVEGNESAGYKKLIEVLTEKKEKGETVIKNVFTGEKIELAGMQLISLWPEKNWVAAQLGTDFLTEDYTEGQTVLGVTTEKDLNDFSLVFLLKYGGFSALFPGDADAGIQDEILLNNPTLEQIDILKVPHHGAKTSLTADFLNVIKPKVAIISVGNNSYGHPNPDLIKNLEDLKVKVRRTDLEGQIKYEL